MHLLTPVECKSWARGAGHRLDAASLPIPPTAEHNSVVCDIPPAFTRLTWFCRHLERSLQPRDACLLWVTAWSIWEENLHLYYRLRQSYNDSRLLHDAPGHLFLNYEAHDIVSFLEVAILCGWDAHLISTVGYARAFVSHDGFVEFAADDANPSIAVDFASKLSLPGEKAAGS
jgi:hypothetical protein